jgi:hypothetical protein
MHPKSWFSNASIYYVLISLLLTMNTKTFAQINNQIDSLINQHLFLVIKSHEQFYNDVWKGKKSVKNDFCIFTDNLSEGFEFSDDLINTEVKFISESKLTESQMEQGVYGVSLSEIFMHNNNLILSYNTKGIKLEGNKVITGLADYYMFDYEYSCNYNKWILVRTSPKDFY